MINPAVGVLMRRNFALFAHSFVTGASGVIASQESPEASGVVATKTAAETGRYTLAVAAGSPWAKGVRKFHGAFAMLTGPDDTVYGAKSKGQNMIARDNDLDGGAVDGTIELQFLNPSTDATNYIDAELPDGTIVHVIGFLSY